MRYILLYALIAFGTPALAEETDIERARSLYQQATQRDIECLKIATDISMNGTAQDPAARGIYLACKQDARDLRAAAINVLEEAEYNLANNWQFVDAGNSPIDDSPTLVLIKISAALNSCGLGDGKNYLSIRCAEGQTTMGFILDGCIHSGIDGGDNGLLRIGQSPAMEMTFFGNGELFAPQRQLELINEMMQNEIVTIRVHPFSAPQQTISFDVSDLEDVIAPLREACHW